MLARCGIESLHSEELLRMLTSSDAYSVIPVLIHYYTVIYNFALI